MDEVPNGSGHHHANGHIVFKEEEDFSDIVDRVATNIDDVSLLIIASVDDIVLSGHLEVPADDDPKLPMPVAPGYPQRLIRYPSDVHHFADWSVMREFFGFLTRLNESARLSAPLDTVFLGLGHGGIIPALLKALDFAAHLINWHLPASPDRADDEFLNWRIHLFSSPILMQDALPDGLHYFSNEINFYFVSSFGRYAAGYAVYHELNFAFWLFCFERLELFYSEQCYDALVALVFPRYLDLLDRVEATYRIRRYVTCGDLFAGRPEFLPFVLGSAELAGLQQHQRAPAEIADLKTVCAYRQRYMFFRAVMKRTQNWVRTLPHDLIQLSGMNDWQEVNDHLMTRYRVGVLEKFAVLKELYYGAIIPES